MKNLSKEYVKDLFIGAGCLLLDDYKKCDVPMLYVCVCGREGYITLDKFRRRLRSNNKCKYCDVRIWTKEEDDCLVSYYGYVSRSQLMGMIPGVTYNELKNRAYKLKLCGNRSFVQRQARLGKGRKYEVNFNFFDEVDFSRSYWAGFIAANGDLNEDRHRLSIRMKDRVHLELFKSVVGYTGQIYEDGSEFLLQCHGIDRWFEKLRVNYSVVSRKLLKPPVDLDEGNSLAFMVGYIDRSRVVGKDLSIRLLGTNDLLCWFKVWFDIWCPSVQRRVSVVRECKRGYSYVVSGHRAGYILRKMNKLDLPKLAEYWVRCVKKP